MVVFYEEKDKDKVLKLYTFLQEQYPDKNLTVHNKAEFCIIKIRFTSTYSVYLKVYSEKILINYDITLLVDLLPTIFLLLFTPKANKFEMDVTRKVETFLNK